MTAGHRWVMRGLRCVVRMDWRAIASGCHGRGQMSAGLVQCYSLGTATCASLGSDSCG